MAGPDRRRCHVCGAGLRVKDRFCSTCGTPVASASVSGTAAPKSASLQVGALDRAKLTEQRKVITILFADLSGSTALGEKLDPEELRAVLTSYFNVLSREIHRFGGTIDKYIGDAVMAVFGAPVAHEDDPERAVRAALGMQRAMSRENDALERKYGVRLTLRIGVNTGEVVAGMLGGDAQSAYTVVGDAVNTAQRLESAAPPNEVLAGEVTYGLTRHAIRYEALAPIPLKGKREPVPVFRALAAVDERAYGDAPPFVGREAELAQLLSHFAEATESRGRVVHVSGEAGVGKSRLLMELLSRVPAAVPALRTRSASYETMTPYALIADLIRRAFRIEPGGDESTARGAMTAGVSPFALPTDETAVAMYLEVLGYEQRSALKPEEKRRIIVSLLRRFLERQCELGTFIVLAEDMHWLDAASRDVLKELLPGIASLRCLVLTTGRDTESVTWPTEHLEMRPLDETSAAALVERLASVGLDEPTRSTILERTAGNPFFIQEVLRAIASGRTKIPATVHEVLQAHLDDLPSSGRRAAERASVIGRTFSVRLLARLLPDEPIGPVLADLEREGLVAVASQDPEPTYAFRHALFQEVAYETQLLAQRRALHGAVGSAVEALYAGRMDEFVDVLAFHYDRSNNDPKALVWLSRAGDRAKSLYANDDAIRLFEQALARARDGEAPQEAGWLLERISDVQRLIGRYDAGMESLRRAQQRIPAPSPVVAARLRRKIGQAHRMRGEYPQALAEYAAALEAIGTDEDAEAAWVRAATAETLWRQGDYASARRIAAEAETIAERVGDDEILAVVLNQEGVIAIHSGDYAAAVEHLQRALPVFERREDPFSIAAVRASLGIVYRRLARYDEALAEQRAGLSVAERVGSPLVVGRGHHNIGEVHRSRGELVEAIAAYERALEHWGPIGYAAGVAITIMLRGATKVGLGDVGDGLTDLLDAERRLLALDSKKDLPDLYRYLAAAELARGDLDRAAAHVERSREFARATEAPHLEAMADRVAAEIALARGREDEARELAENSRRVLAERNELDELRRTEQVLERLTVATRR